MCGENQGRATGVFALVFVVDGGGEDSVVHVFPPSAGDRRSVVDEDHEAQRIQVVPWSSP